MVLHAIGVKIAVSVARDEMVSAFVRKIIIFSDALSFFGNDGYFVEKKNKFPV